MHTRVGGMQVGHFAVYTETIYGNVQFMKDMSNAQYTNNDMGRWVGKRIF